MSHSYVCDQTTWIHLRLSQNSLIFLSTNWAWCTGWHNSLSWSQALSFHLLVWTFLDSTILCTSLCTQSWGTSEDYVPNIARLSRLKRKQPECLSDVFNMHNVGVHHYCGCNKCSKINGAKWCPCWVEHNHDLVYDWLELCPVGSRCCKVSVE